LLTSKILAFWGLIPVDAKERSTEAKGRSGKAKVEGALISYEKEV
jgi:hypothetical protein